MNQRGFTTLETTLAIAMMATLLLATASSLGLRPPRAHAAAIAFEAALAEARALASVTAAETDGARPTGATVYVASDPFDAGSSFVTVYRSRPIPSGPGNSPATLPLDAGFPPQRVAAKLTVGDGLAPPVAPFAILVSSSGYASVAAPLGWDPGRSARILTSDPGCTEGAVTVAADDGSRREAHPLSCRDASYDASH